VHHAGEGASSAQQVNEKLAEILDTARRVNDIVAAMASSARDQTNGIEQVNRAVGEMDRVTQQNAASSEQASSAAAQLSSQAEELAAMVGSFRLGAAERAAIGPRERRRPAGSQALA
jgi:methyl-accepting chemotaxis protein